MKKLTEEQAAAALMKKHKRSFERADEEAFFESMRYEARDPQRLFWIRVRVALTRLRKAPPKNTNGRTAVKLM